MDRIRKFIAWVRVWSANIALLGVPTCLFLAALITGGVLFGSLSRAPGGMAAASNWSLLAAGLLIASGIAGTITQWALRSSRRRTAALNEENEKLRIERDTLQDRAMRFARHVESLSLLREIHRTGNIANPPERIRRLLGVVADITEAVDLTLFELTADEGASVATVGADGRAEAARRARPVAYFSRGEAHELYLFFDPRVDPDASLFYARDVTEYGTEAKFEAHGFLYRGESKVGEATLTIDRTSKTNAILQGAPERILNDTLSLSPISRANLEEAIARRTRIRTRDPQRGSADLTYPLAAEGGLVGALKLRIECKADAESRLDAVEELLQEGARHIAMAIKKEETANRARLDGLTHLFLKRELSVVLREQISHAAEGSTFSLIMVDLDHFKQVNDTHGHLTGDRVLRTTADVIRNHLRGEDLAFRYGGEEMAVVLPGARLSAASKTAERLRAALEDTRFENDQGVPIPITASFGVVEFELAVAGSEELISRADQALYVSKEKGRNRVTAWPDHPVRRSRKEKRDLESSRESIRKIKPSKAS